MSETYATGGSGGAVAMNLAISPELQKRLTEAASKRGLEPAEFARQVLEEHVPDMSKEKPNKATLELLEQWEREGATDEPQEVARRQQEGDELMQNLARNRLEMEG